VQKNLLRILLAIEAMLNGAAFGFIGIAGHLGQVEGHVMFLMVLAIASAEVGVALAVVLHYDRLFKSLDIDLLAKPEE
jgi:NADH-quinone oxidoreductase subunit K